MHLLVTLFQQIAEGAATTKGLNSKLEKNISGKPQMLTDQVEALLRLLAAHLS